MELTSREVSFGEWLRQRRRALDWTQADLASRAGCARITLRRIEADELKPSKELAAILLEKVGIPEAGREAWIRFARGLAPLPAKAGTVTFLFTDVEGSTRLASESPARWESLRERLGAILQAAAATHHGRVFQTVGDAHCLAFSSASDGLHAALDAQRRLQSEDWGSKPVKVRMGLHTGEAELRADGNYQGYLALSLVQRLMSVGHGGQVLLSGTAESLLRDQLPENVSLRDLGEHELKDAPGPVHIFQAVAPGLQSDFPALRVLDIYPNNLPIQLTSFIGREKEIEELREALNAHRLVTLTGSGGSGKTRLSLQVAAGMLEKFRHGAWLVELAPLADRDLLPSTLANVLGVHDQPGRPLTTTLIEWLSHRELLLILDNCEHLIESCAGLAELLLRSCKEVKILATSREALGVAGEVAWPVPSLSTPDFRQLPDVEALAQYEATRLFIDRASLIQPHFAVTKDNAPAIAQICHHLDGIPLAIELAGARAKGLSVEEIAARLDDRFRLLTGGRRTALPRQRTLQATIDWSYRLLSEDERTVLRRLSVFAGSWNIAAAEAVCAGDHLAVDRILELQLHLVDKSLVIAQTESAEPRYRMLETIRQFAQEKLDEGGETPQARARHLAHFIALAERAEPELSGHHQVLWLDRLEVETDNLRAALSWAQEQNPESFLRLASALWRFWSIRSSTSEAVEWLEKALALNEGLHTVTRALALGRVSWMQSSDSLWDGKRAPRRAEEALALSRELGDKPALALALFVQGSSAVNMNQPEAARAYLEQAIALAWELGDHGLAGLALIFLGREAYFHNDLGRARQCVEQGLEEARLSGDKRRIVTGLGLLADIALEEGNARQAIALRQEATDLAREIGDHENLAWSFWYLAGVAIYLEDYPRAAQLLAEASQLSQEWGDRIMLARVSLYAALLAWAQGELGSEAKLLEDVLVVGRELDLDDLKAYALYLLAHIARLGGDPELARARFTGALPFFGHSERGGYCMCFDGLAALALERGQAERAVRLFAASRKLNATTWVRFDLPFMVREREGYIAQARAQLGEEAFSTAWAAGQAMSEEEMLAYAVEDEP